jgi:hypothetical protein
VLPPEGKDAYRFDPRNLTIPLAELEQRYDPEVWKAFKQIAMATFIIEGVETLWDWLVDGK